jgi:hypothetical protein
MNLPCFDGQVDAVEGMRSTKRLGEIAQLQNWSAAGLTG